MTRLAIIACVIPALAVVGTAEASPSAGTKDDSVAAAKRKPSPANSKSKPSAKSKSQAKAPTKARTDQAKTTSKATAKSKAPKPGTVDLFTLRPRRTAPARKVDLFPPHLFGRGQLSPLVASRSERRRGLGLGNDGDWRVQTAQIGAMALGWVALAGLCGGGKCLIPNKWIPGPLRAKPYRIPNPVLPQTRRGTDLGRDGKR